MISTPCAASAAQGRLSEPSWKSQRSKAIAAIAILAGFGGLIFFARLHTYEEPLERDIAIYAVIGHGLLHGKSLYVDLWDHKPPAIYATYAAAEAVAGYGRDTIFLLNVTAAIAAMVGCYFAGRAGGGRTGGIVAALLWSLASGDVALQGNQPNTELFLNALLATGFALIASREQRNFRISTIVSAGVIFGIASLFKPVVVVQAGALAISHVLCANTTYRRKAIVDATVVGAIGLIIWAILLGYFSITGRSEIFRETVFTYNRYYSGNLWTNVSQLLKWPTIGPDVLSVLIPLAVLTLIASAIGIAVGPRRKWILLIAFSVATQISVLLPGRPFPHYYQLWLVPLVIGAGWSFALFKQVLPSKFSLISGAAAGLVCLVVALIELPSYRTSAEGWSIEKYGDIFVKTDRLARQLPRVLLPNETFYEWGNESGLYFERRQSPPSGVIFAYHVLRGPMVEELSNRLLRDLNRAKPDLVVADSWTLSQSANHPVTNWIVGNYRPFAQTDRFVLCARKGSALDQRRHSIAAN